MTRDVTGRTLPSRRARLSRRLVIAPLVLGLALAACGDSDDGGGGESEGAASTGPINIGVVLPLTGAIGSSGADAVTGVELAIAQANEAGGVLDRQVEFEQEDTVSDPAQAATQGQRFGEDEKFSAIIGPISAQETAAIAPVVERFKIVSFNTTGSGVIPNQDQVFNGWVFRIVPAQSLVTAPTMEAVIEAVGDVKKVAILNYSDNSAYVGARDIWMETAEGLGLEVDHQEFPTTTQDFGPIVSNVLKSKPDVIFLGAAPATIGPLIKQIRNGGVEAPFVGDAGMFDPQVYEVSGGESVGSYSNTGYLATENPSNEEFIATYEEEFGREPSSTAAYAYDLTNILLDAIERAGSTDRQAIRDALASTSNFAGLSGEISFGEEGGDAQRTSISLVRLAEEGRLEKVADIPLG